MGVTSPFITAVTSPFIQPSSRASTPKFLLLDLVEGDSDKAEVEFCSPQLELREEEQKVHAHDELIELAATPDATVQEERSLRTDSAPVPREVPAWPSHLPSYMDQVFVQNSFLEVPHATVTVPRRRAASDWSGVLNLEEAGFEVRIEELKMPLPQSSVSASTIHEVANNEQSPKPSRDKPTQWGVPSEAADEWAGARLVDNASQEVPSLPLLVDGQEPYRPKWVYGSSWPFNHAPTTLILDNLPRSLMQVQLLAILDGNGFSGLYDFCFLPINLRNGKNDGHAIVNFTRHSYGSSFAACVQGFQNWDTEHDENRPCEVRWSLPLQGLFEHVQKYRNHPCMHESVPEAFRPMIFDCGWNVPFPYPTQPIRAPRMGQW